MIASRRATFAFTVAVIGISSPALAQDYRIESEAIYDDAVYANPDMAGDAYAGTWTGEWVAPDRYQGTWQGEYDARGSHYGAGHDQGYYGSQFAYSPRERDMWLQQCRANYFEAGSGRRGPDGALIGGLVGAVAGGVIGNRVGDGSRLGGTVLGAGVGGLAGAVIGDAIDGEDEAEAQAYDYCESYLREYEAYGARPGPVRWVKVPIRRVSVTRPVTCECGTRQEVIEEEVVIEHPAPVTTYAPRPTKVVKQVKVAPRSSGKTTKLRPSK